MVYFFFFEKVTSSEDFCSLPFSLELQQLLTRVVYFVSFLGENVQHVEVFSHHHNVSFL